MTTAMDKAKISAVTAFFTAIATFVYGYVNFVMITGLAAFLFALMVQYNVFKIKILIPLATILGIVYWILSGKGLF